MPSWCKRKPKQAFFLQNSENRDNTPLSLNLVLLCFLPLTHTSNGEIILYKFWYFGISEKKKSTGGRVSLNSSGGTDV